MVLDPVFERFLRDFICLFGPLLAGGGHFGGAQMTSQGGHFLYVPGLALLECESNRFRRTLFLYVLQEWNNELLRHRGHFLYVWHLTPRVRFLYVPRLALLECESNRFSVRQNIRV